MTRLLEGFQDSEHNSAMGPISDLDENMMISTRDAPPN